MSELAQRIGNEHGTLRRPPDALASPTERPGARQPRTIHRSKHAVRWLELFGAILSLIAVGCAPICPYPSKSAPDCPVVAMADPYRLLRNTSFDKRQILRWIDGALLMVYLPEAYVSLERQGIIGAMSLAWYAQPDRRASLEVVAAEAKLGLAMLSDTVQRLSEDRQLQQVQLLYHLTDTVDWNWTSAPKLDERAERP